MSDFWKDKRVIVTGGTGFVGSHLVDALRESGNDPFVPTSCHYDLRDWTGIQDMFFDAGDPIDVLFHLAGDVGGIGYNQAHPYRLFHDNAMMGIQLIDAAIGQGVDKFVQVGTVCAYPKNAPVPFGEWHLWEGYPEETNAPYGLAKRMLLVQLQAARAEFGFDGIYLLPTNLYGPRDEFDPTRSHVIPALIRKFVEARETGADRVVVWGTGKVSRDFLYVRDAVQGLLLAAEKYSSPEPLNLGSGSEVFIFGLVEMIKEITGFRGTVAWDSSKPDGQPRRKLNTNAARKALGWQPKTDLKTGLERTVEWYEKERESCPISV